MVLDIWEGGFANRGVGIRVGCGAHYEARWVGEPRYGVEVYEVSQV
jgi:hypothetical protein